jgi:hypothetical protein
MGPGTEIEKLLKSLDLAGWRGCGCAGKVRQMNAWGVVGCRKHRDQIVGWLREASRQAGWRTKLAAATKAASIVPPEHWLDPIPWLVDEAIRRGGPQPTTIATRNLLYHVCPLAENDVWLANVRQVRRRLDLFNGRRIVAVATGEGMLSPEDVRAAFGDRDIEYLEIPNDRRLREVASFRALLDCVAEVDAKQATFYAHTKGNSTRENRTGAMYWRNAMYHHLLDGWPECIGHLESGMAAVGTHKMIWGTGRRSPYPTKLQHGEWMFAGTFFWFRNDVVFGREWQNVPNDRYGAEAWLSGILSPGEARSVFQPWPETKYPTPSPYKPELYVEPIADE